MKILIIEDEIRAANRLEKLLKEIDSNVTILDKKESVRGALEFFHKGITPDLILSDIQLEDGLSFEIFEQIEVPCPIVFTTAYDQYAIAAFQTNGIDYLLKPIEKERLKQSLQKAIKLSQSVTLEHILALANTAMMKKDKYKSRFVTRVGEKIKSISTGDIKVFYSQENTTYLFSNEERKYIIDFSLDQLEQLLDPEQFIRISRKYIVSIKSCKDIIAWSNSRLKIQVKGLDDHMMVVARERVQAFKEWLDD